MPNYLINRNEHNHLHIPLNHIPNKLKIKFFKNIDCRAAVCHLGAPQEEKSPIPGELVFFPTELPLKLWSVAPFRSRLLLASMLYFEEQIRC